LLDLGSDLGPRARLKIQTHRTLRHRLDQPAPFVAPAWFARHATTSISFMKLYAEALP
jgi:hypothetical protein